MADPAHLSRWRRRIPPIVLGSLLGLGGWLGSTGMATANTQVWGGTGQVLSGQGQGATVQLVIEVNNGRIRTQSGPNLDAPFGGGYQSIHTSDGMWQIQQDGEQLSITLHRGDQIIRYQLLPQFRDPNLPALNQQPLNPTSSSNSVVAPLAPSGGGSQIAPINVEELSEQPLLESWPQQPFPSQETRPQNSIEIMPFPTLMDQESP
ncbi:MAG: hypothetical protein HC924_12495 [Synechococcaceae cyanobacterium SM2_3_2]|nr:hypothetical protein [Synechococcaceae cyanobacterium SM2_3_2]